MKSKSWGCFLISTVNCDGGGLRCIPPPTSIKSSLSSSHSSQKSKILNLFSAHPHLSLPKTLALTAASGLLFHLTSSALSFLGNGPGGRGVGVGGDNNGCGGGDDGFWGRLFTLAVVIAQDEDDDSKSPKLVRFTETRPVHRFFKKSNGSPGLKRFIYIFGKIIKLNRYEVRFPVEPVQPPGSVRF
ncbi:hypothetical protein Acr_15g0016070 [Actinidia rufa]|uniref:Uncharacterized protein n=1 Tax=Actinidia rufa TaxID=165716 RepID=A0A7J0FWC9_9ERIC|nr:hypothetical protein Acr_15g0016070 [Actinidia rufa]